MNARTLALGVVLLLAADFSPPAVAGWFFPGQTLQLDDGRRLIPGGYAGDSGLGYMWAVVRVNADGSPDRTFGAGGVTTVTFWHEYEFGWKAAALSDGRVVVAGTVQDPVLDFCYGDCGTMTALVRLNPDGSFDPGFNGTGRLIVSIGGAEKLPQLPNIAYLKRFEVDDTGRITIFGYPESSADQDPVAARINPDGTFDAAFRAHEYQPGPKVRVAEAFNPALGHYFLTWSPEEITALDLGAPAGWSATRQRFFAYSQPQPGASPVCRFYIPPPFGDSHFFGRDEAECAATAAAHPEYVLESAAYFYMSVPVAGECSAATAPVYRIFNNRPDANHRYVTDKTLRDSMVRDGWIAEGDGPDQVTMCAPR